MYINEVKCEKFPSCVRLFVTPWTTQSMDFSRPEYWRSHSLFQGIFPTQELNTYIAGGFFTSWATREAQY